MQEVISNLVENYFHEGCLNEIANLGNGKIHKTYKVNVEFKQKDFSADYIVQEFNREVFPDYISVINNQEQVACMLREASIDAPFLVRAKNNNKYMELKNSIFRVMPYIKGNGVDRNNYEELRISARTLAEFHNALNCKGDADFKPFHNLNYHFKVFKADSSVKLNKHLEKDKLFAAVEKYAYLTGLYTTERAEQICHNDPKLENIIIIDKLKGVLIDFDTLGLGYYELDLADMVRSAIKGRDFAEITTITALIYKEYGKVKEDKICPENFLQALKWIFFELFLRYLNDYCLEREYFAISKQECIFNAMQLLETLELIEVNEKKIKSFL